MMSTYSTPSYRRLQFGLLASLLPVCVYAQNPNDAQVLDTASFRIQIEVNCREGEVECDKVIYRGESKRTNKTIVLAGRTAHTRCADKVTPCRFLGYTFRNGSYTYFVSTEGRLSVRRGEKVVVEETGQWL